MARLIGVFGGTFDPPHLGHLILADQGRRALGLEKVLWVVTGQQPLKPDEPITRLELRLAMVEAAIADNPAFEISRADIDRPGPHYSVGTLHWLSARLPGAELTYLMGADSLRDLPTWHTPVEFVQACAALGVMRRPGVEADLDALEAAIPGLKAKTRLFDAPAVDISASDIRRRVHLGESYRYLVHSGVAEFIRRQGLYR